MSESFDYIVVGGGSAGAVLAARLSENPGRSVCLLEAGPADRDLRIKIPAALVSLMKDRRHNWLYRSEPHRHLGGAEASIPRGKTLGGSGSINSMVYIRGRASDYDDWSRHGCSGWDWDSVLPVFRRMETNVRLADDPLHGDSGPLIVEDLPSPHPLSQRFARAGLSLGIPENRDFNGQVQEGLGVYQTNMRNGRRWSAADAYLRPALERPNLKVITEAEVDRILFEGRRATGVELCGKRRGQKILARAQVVLSAGAIGSPAILLRSGVGPAAELQALGISPVHDLPAVGRNLHDHPALPVFHAGPRSGYGLALSQLPLLAAAPFKYLFSRRGLLASNMVEAGGFARTLSELDEPDVQFHFIPGRVGHQGRTVVWGRGYTADVCVLKPKSRGRLTLKSVDPETAPRIDLNLLADQADEDCLVRGLSLLRQILASPAFDGVRSPEIHPGPAVSSEDEMRRFVRSQAATSYHPVGSCRMGSVDDAESVVDPTLKVIGLENVRVADASVMPWVIAGNTNFPSMMIGERAADLIDRHGKI